MEITRHGRPLRVQPIRLAFGDGQAALWSAISAAGRILTEELPSIAEKSSISGYSATFEHENRFSGLFGDRAIP